MNDEPDFIKLYESDLTTGGILKAARQSCRQSVQDIADVVRIRVSLIEAMEDDRYEDLPGRVYVIGFIRSYASYLQLDPDILITRYKRETSGRQDDEPDLKFPTLQKDSKMPSRGVLVGSMIALIVISIVWAQRDQQKSFEIEPFQAPPASIKTGAEE